MQGSLEARPGDLFSDRLMFSVRCIMFVAHGTVNKFYRMKETHCPDSHSHSYPESRFSLLFHFMLVTRTLIFTYFSHSIYCLTIIVGYTDI